MKKVIVNICFLAVCAVGQAQDQKVIGDCTVTFSISNNDATAKSAAATKTIYVKGKVNRVDFASADYLQSVIYNYTTGDAVILQQVGGNKYMTKLNADKWKDKNAPYLNANLTFGNDTKTILGYVCKQGTATFANGETWTFYYATTIIPSVAENPFQFKNIPGFVLEYQIAGKDNKSITFTATKLDLSPVPESKFDIPTSGYLVRD
jgi:GLPGLI family protein